MTQQQIIEMRKAIADAIASNAELKELRDKHAASIDAFNLIAKGGAKKDAATRANGTDDIEVEYAAKAAVVVYKKLAELGDDMLPAIVCHDFAVLSHKDKDENQGTEEQPLIVRVRTADTKEKVINLVKYDDFCKKTYGAYRTANHDCWAHIECLNYLMTEDARKNLCAAAGEPYAFRKGASNLIAASKVIGASNSALLKTLQAIADMVIFTPNAETKGNIYKAVSHDVAYMRYCQTAKGKTRCSVKCIDHKAMNDVISNILYRIAINGQYSLEYKSVKPKGDK